MRWGKLADARAQVRHKQLLQAQFHFEANHTILHRERKHARVERQHDQCRGCEAGHHRTEREMPEDLDDVRHEIDQEYGKREEMIGRDEPCVVLEILRHGVTSSSAERKRWTSDSSKSGAGNRLVEVNGQFRIKSLAQSAART